MPIPFDTNEQVRRLEAAGFQREQAEVVVKVVSAAQTGADLATKTDLEALRVATKTDLEALRVAAKTDLEALRAELHAEIQAVRTDLRTEIQALRLEIRDTRIDTIKWFAGLLLAQAGLITALVKLL